MRDPGFMGLAKQRASQAPMMPQQEPQTPDEQAALQRKKMLQQQISAQMMADRNQSRGMVEKMEGFQRLQDDKDNMTEVPRTYEPPGGGREQLAYVNPKEMQMLKRAGGSGEMTPYGIPSFEADWGSAGGGDVTGSEQGLVSGGTTGWGDAGDMVSGWGDAVGDWWDKSTKGKDGFQPQTDQPGGSDERGSGRDGGSGGFTQAQIDAAREEGKTAGTSEGMAKGLETGKKAGKEEYLTGERGNLAGEFAGYKDEAKGLGGQTKTATDRFGKLSGDLEGYQSKFDQIAADSKTRGDKAEQYFQDKGTEFQNLATAGANTQTGFGKDMEGLAKDAGDMRNTYGDIGAAYKGVDGQGMVDAASAAQKGIKAQTDKMSGLEGDVDTAVKEGQEGFRAGASDVETAKKQFGAEGFQKESADLQGRMKGLEGRTEKLGQRGQGYEETLSGYADKAMSGDVGRAQGEQLRGQMEQQRMASQKGSEEKLRRELAQSGASPSEIAAKVAQFQKQSSSDQASAGRQERLSSALQGQQMGQSQLGQAAGMTQSALGALNPQMQAQGQQLGQQQAQAGLLGQRAGFAGQQANLGAQQAALTGQSAAMGMQGTGQKAGLMGQQLAGAQASGQFGMQGAQGQQQAQLASLSGQMGAAGGQMGALGQQAGMTGQAAGIHRGATGMGMQGLQGAAGMYGQGLSAGMQGSQMQGSMLGQGMGALESAGGMTGQQMKGIGQQGAFVDQQAGYTQAQLNDIIANQTMDYTRQNAAAVGAANAGAQGGGGSGGGGFLGKLGSATGLW